MQRVRDAGGAWHYGRERVRQPSYLVFREKGVGDGGEVVSVISSGEIETTDEPAPC